MEARGRACQGGFARWIHVILHCSRAEKTHSYRETPSRLKYMDQVRDALDLARDDLPDQTTVYNSLDRLKMWIWWALGWYRQFRKIVLMFAIIDIEPLCEPL